MEHFDIGKLISEYDEGEITRNEVACIAFKYLHSHREDIDAVLAELRNHPEESITSLATKLLTWLNSPIKHEKDGEKFDS